MIDFDKTKEVEAIHRYIAEGKYNYDNYKSEFKNDLLEHLGIKQSVKSDYLINMAFKYGCDLIDYNIKNCRRASGYPYHSLHSVVFTAEDLLPLIVME